MKERTSGERSDSGTTPHPSETVYANLERLLAWFQEHEVRLRAWLSESDKHVQLFLLDPVSAVSEAGLYLDPELVPELTSISSEISRTKTIY